MTSVGLIKRNKQLNGFKHGLDHPVYKPHAYQKRGVEWLLKHPGAGLFADPGCGKSAIVLRALLALKDAGKKPRALVVAPLRVAHTVWPTEAGEWAGSEWQRMQQLRVALLHGDDKDRALREDADIYVINPEGLAWLFEHGGYRKFHALGIDTLVIDESSKFKRTRTQRFKLLKPILKTFDRRWILTGSPNPNGYLDLFGQIYIIDLGAALSPYITHYRLNYFTPLDMMGWSWRLKSGAEKQIQKRVAPYIFRLDAKDYLEIPELKENIVRVDLPQDARRVYDEMEDLLITELKSTRKIMATNVGAAQTKCAQIANGGIYHMPEDDLLSKQRHWTGLHDAKLEAVEDIVDELQGSPCMIVYEFQHDLARLLKLYPHAPCIGGDTSGKESEKIIARWNNNEISILLAHPAAVSHGLNLQYGAAQHILWHSLTWNYEHYDQLNRRLRRQGSKHENIFVHLIVARDTVDEAKLTALRRKCKEQNSFLDALREYTLRRARVTR